MLSLILGLGKGAEAVFYDVTAFLQLCFRDHQGRREADNVAMGGFG